MGLITNFLTTLGLMRKKCHVLLVGLDNSGKSTIINQLKPDKIPTNEIVPTVGFNIEHFSKKNLNFTVFDMSGQGRYRDLWEHYYADADAIIFVIDTSDKVRICVARDELEELLGHKLLRAKRIPILFLANKTDIPNGMAPGDVSNALALEQIKDKNWYICGCNALTGHGLGEGLDWLGDQLNKS